MPKTDQFSFENTHPIALMTIAVLDSLMRGQMTSILSKSIAAMPADAQKDLSLEAMVNKIINPLMSQLMQQVITILDTNKTRLPVELEAQQQMAKALANNLMNNSIDFLNSTVSQKVSLLAQRTRTPGYGAALPVTRAPLTDATTLFNGERQKPIIRRPSQR